LPSISPSDLFLSATLTEDEAREYLGSFGLVDPGAADQHLQALAEELPTREALGALAETLLDAVSRAPDPDAAVVAFSRYTATRLPRASFLRYLADDPRALDVLIEVTGTSPFLAEILIRNPEYFHWLVSQVDRPPPEIEDLAEEADLQLAQAENESGHGNALRRFKRREILRIAARDILGGETLESATTQISDLADVVAERALRIATRTVLEGASPGGEPRGGQPRGGQPLDRLPGSFVVLGMGKLGGRELNYSSDIDLLFVYEPDDEDDDANHRLFHKLARALVSVLTEFTDESYLYRVDLRLRPMGRRGNIAYSLRQHAQYYDTWGETFERFALLKARPLAGDLELGKRFLDLVEPFVYRRYLDHAALEEIFRFKQRAERQEPDLDRDVKIGRGGIREIEVFTQVLQLTYGARDRTLRQASTLRALEALAAAGLIADGTHETLVEAYEFLRTLEHRLQIVQEQQTHSLSRAERELDICARRVRLGSAAELESELEKRRDRVHGIWSGLFERRPGALDYRSRQWFRVLSDAASDEEAAALLAEHRLGPDEAALAAIRALDEATALAPSRSMARNVLANLLPTLLDRIGSCARPGQVLIRLEQLTERTGAAAAFFRTLLEDEPLRDRLIATLDLGELAAARLVRHPELLDSLMQPLPDQEALRARWQETLARVDPANRAAEIRRFKEVEELKILVQWIADREAGEGEPASEADALPALQERLSALAECAITAAAEWTAAPPPVSKRRASASSAEPDWVILALGKLGGRELAIHSDLDLVIVYEGRPRDSATFMAKQAMATAFDRLLEEPTADGIAYHVDTRLRPEGKKGALAMPLVAFERYLRERAEIWERLAWTRFRAIAGSPSLAKKVEEAVHAFVYGPWDPRIPTVMSDLRRRMERELAQPGGAHLELKIGRGGLADVDFAVQMIQIREGSTRAEMRVRGTREALARIAGTPYLEPHELRDLEAAYLFLRRLELFARLDVDAGVSAIPADPERLDVLGRRLELPVPAQETLSRSFAATTERVRAIYEAVLARL
jgi:glutamate-ammonia-ligase adenylyltransferase